jgi:hypothetical protein
VRTATILQEKSVIDTTYYIAYGRPVTRQRWIESIAADCLSQYGNGDNVTICVPPRARCLRTCHGK